MLKSLGEFQPYGRRHTALHPHLINDSSEVQEVDFNLFSKGASSANRQKTSSCNLYAVDGRPLKYINELSGDIVEQTAHQDCRRLPNGAMDLEEELYVDGSTVVWSRGGHIVKSFKFELERQPVELALFAWFRFTDGEGDDKSTAKGRWHEDIYYDDGRIQGNEQSSNMMDIVSKKRKHPDVIYENSSSNNPNNNKRRGTTSSSTLRKALCIILRDSVKIYFEDGLMYSVHLNFPVQRAYALHVGLILERKRAELIDDANAAFLQPFVCITDPMGECELVTMTDDMNRSFSLDFRKDMMGVPVDHELVFATSVDYSRGDSDKQQLIVTYNSKKHAHYVWMLTDEEERLKQPKIKRKPPPQSAATFSSLKSRKKSKSKRGVKHNNMPSPIAATTPPPLTRKDSLAQFHEDFSSDTDQLYGSEAGDSFHESEDAGHFLHLLYETNPTKGDRRKHARDTAFLAHDNDGMDLLCIMRNREQTVLVLSISKLLTRDMDALLKKISARSAVSITSSNGHRHILLLRTGNRIQLVLEPRKEILVDVILPSTLSDKMKELSDTVAASFNVHMADGRIERYRIETLPYSGLVQDGTAALQCVLPNITHALFRKRFIEHLYSTLASNNSVSRMTCEWVSFIIALLSFLPLDNSSLITTTTTLLDKVSAPSFPSWSSLVESSMKLRQSYAGEYNAIDLESVLKCLHMLREDYRLSQIKSQSLMPKLNHLMILLSVLSGNQEWIAHYTKDTCSFSQVLSETSHVKDKKSMSPPTDVIGAIRYYSPIPPNRLSLEDVFGIPRIDPVVGLRWNTFGHTIDMVWLLYRMLRAEEYERLVDRMVQEEIKRYEIEDLHPIIGEPLLAALDLLRENPPMTWTIEHYNLIGRQDMIHQILGSNAAIDPNGDHFRLDTVKLVRTNMHDLCKSIATVASSSRSSNQAYDFLDVQTEKLRFGYQGILETVRTLLDITRIPELTVPDRPDLNDADLHAEHQIHMWHLLQRTSAISVGRGMFSFGTYTPDLTKDFPIEAMNLQAKLLPLRTMVTADDRQWAPEYFDWPRFHQGVAAGLKISPSCRVGGSWIDFCNREEELRPEHGGFLLALGLNGNLRDLPLISWYRYMTQPCELAATGFVLGLGSAYRGTRNGKVTKLLAVHIPALLPSGSTTLNHSIAIQSTSLVSLGLVFMGSCDRLMSSMMVAEIERYAEINPSTLEANFEGCALAAGFALGFVTLGCGDESAGIFDLHLKEKLYRLMLGQTTLSTATATEETRRRRPTTHVKTTTTTTTSSSQQDNGSKPSRDKLSEPAAKPINLDVTSPGATIALGLMYMRTNNARVAETIDIVKTRPYLNHIRPDLLMLRIIARNLIMWNSIQPTNEWIDSHIPDFIKQDIHQEHTMRSSQLIEGAKQAMYYMISGACLSLGLRFAGSDNKQAFQCLLSRLDNIMKISNMTAVGFQESITRSVIRSCVGVIATAAAMVVAGTGNLDLLSRLKVLHGRVGPQTQYGDHMPIHMAMGLLYAGIGGYTISSSMEATAGLLCAFYPFYPIAADDNRYYLQAFRHLWVIAMDMRWLMPLDVETGKPVRVPLLVNVQQDTPWLPEQVTREMRIFAPSVLPSYTFVKSIRLDTTRYYPICLNLDGSPYQKAVTNSGVLYIQRRPGCKTHDECPDDTITLDSVMSLKID